jgi:hypothetical protein
MTPFTTLSNWSAAWPALPPFRFAISFARSDFFICREVSTPQSSWVAKLLIVLIQILELVNEVNLITV